MFPYYLLIGLPLFLSLFRYSEENKLINKRFPLLAFFLIFIALLSLRNLRCGTDLVTYYNKFILAEPFSFSSPLNLTATEPGYTLFVALFRSITGSFRLFLVVCAAISVMPIMLLYFKETNHNLLSIALFVGMAPFSIFFSGIRQSIAIGIGAICYWCCKKNKLILFILLVVLAFSFHQTAIMLLPMYPLTHVKITKKWILPISALYAACLVFNKQIFGFFLGISQRYENRYVIQETGSYTFLFLLLIITAYTFIILDDSDETVFRFKNLIVLSLFLQCFAPINIVAMRLNYYYLIFIPILIPKIIENSKMQFRKVAVISEYVFVFFFFIWFFKEAYTGADFLNIFPYVPFWVN